MKSGNNICILAKAPKSGKVKAKLESCLGARQSAFLARALLLDTLSVALKVPRCQVSLAFWPADARRDFSNLLHLFKNEEKNARIKAKTDSIFIMPQTGCSPGELVGSAARQLFENGCRKALLVCSDNPRLEPVVLMASFELLKHANVILGPTFDGSFYLIGMDSYYLGLFDEIEWTPGRIYRNLLERINRAKLKWLELEISYDVDTPQDLEQLYYDIDNLRLAGKNDICRHTENCLLHLKR
jgi:hypothetical protein